MAGFLCAYFTKIGQLISEILSQRWSYYCKDWAETSACTFEFFVLLIPNFCDTHTKIERHTKVKGRKSPFDGDWTYWTARLGRDPTKPKRVCVLMKIQKGRCAEYGLRLRATDVLEVHHWDGNHHNHHYKNLALLHGHCHDFVHRSQVLMTTATWLKSGVMGNCYAPFGRGSGVGDCPADLNLGGTLVGKEVWCK